MLDVAWQIALGTWVPPINVGFGVVWLTVIAPRIVAHRELVGWLNTRYNDRSLRKLFLSVVGGVLLFELYWLGLVLYTVGVRLFSLTPGKRAVKEQQSTGDAELGEMTRRPRDPELGWET